MLALSIIQQAIIFMRLMSLLIVYATDDSPPLGAKANSSPLDTLLSSPRYQLSAEEASRWRIKNNVSAVHAVTTTHAHEKRDYRNYLALETCSEHDETVHNEWGPAREVEAYYWLSAQCLAPYRSPFFFVWCLKVHQEYFQNRLGAEQISVDRFLGECPLNYHCIDTTSTQNGWGGHIGLYNNVKCRPNPHDGDSDSDDEYVAIKTSRRYPTHTCSSTRAVPQSFSYLPKYGGGSRYKRRRRVYDVQEEITHSNGKDYKADKLYFRDMDVPFHVDYHRAELTGANVTHTEVVIDSQGITERNFQFCAQMKRSEGPDEGPWVILYHSVEDITDKGPGRIHGDS